MAWMCSTDVCTSRVPEQVVMRSGAVGEDVRLEKRPSFILDNYNKVNPGKTIKVTR